MNLRSQIILLLLLLIALISWCVYSYDYDLVLNDNSSDIQQINNSDNNEIAQINEQMIIIETNTQDNTFDENIKENDFINNSLDNIEQDINDEKENVEKKIKEINTNELIEPLITINEKYIRENNKQRIENLSQKTQKLQITIIDVLKRYPIIFKSQSNITTQDSNIAISKIVDILNEYQNIKIEVAGHTDSSGPEALNKQISLKRAINIQNKLIQLGIDENRIITRGYGEGIPLVRNSKDGYSRRNRRVEFNIIQE